MRQIIFIKFFLLLLFCNHFLSIAQDMKNSDKRYWSLSSSNRIVWDITKEKKLPHSDNIEMSGRKVSAIIHYKVDENRKLTVTRDVIFPQLRTIIKSGEPDYMNYRAYLRHQYEDELAIPPIITRGKTFVPGPVDSVAIDGKLNFFYSAVGGLVLTRILFPSMKERLFVEKWNLYNSTDSVQLIQIGKTETVFQEEGKDGTYIRKTFSSAEGDISIQPKGVFSFYILFAAQLNDERIPTEGQTAEQERNSFLNTINANLVLETPDQILNTLFHFSKIRAAESIFDSKMGIVHSPGGGRYYTGIWANDQAEYANPFFPYLGYEPGVEASMNSYLMFLKNIPPPGKKIWASFEMQGDLPCCSHDRGDAAMIAFGATHFALASGREDYAKKLWPLIDWSLRYCKSKKNSAGVIESDSDELEGRFPSGDANLSTSSLYYGALVRAARLAKALKKPYKQYITEAEQIELSIEKYFGAELQDLKTYRYYEGNTTLRSWISLPLVVGINRRREGTLEALFSRLWTDNGVKIEDNPKAEQKVFWDRGTLYAFRGAFKAGAADRAVEKLQAYSASRLLGMHVPYAVEAWPEGGMAHLSAESALYARIFIEGMIALEPEGFKSFSIRPHLPTSWSYVKLKKIKAFDSTFDILITRENKEYVIEIIKEGTRIKKQQVKEGEKLMVTL